MKMRRNFFFYTLLHKKYKENRICQLIYCSSVKRLSCIINIAIDTIELRGRWMYICIHNINCALLGVVYRVYRNHILTKWS